MIQVMSLGSNCADLFFTGVYRVQGPVDNWFASGGFVDVLCLFNDFKKMIKKGYNETGTKKKIRPSDCDRFFQYDHYRCVHLNMDDPEVAEKVISRHESFLKFIDKVKNDPDCYFIYTINSLDVYRKNKKWISKKHIVEVMKKLSKYFPVHKIIFVGTPVIKHDKDAFKFYADEFPKEFNYLNIPDVQFDKNKSCKKFSDYILKLNKKQKSNKNAKKSAPKIAQRAINYDEDWDD